MAVDEPVRDRTGEEQGIIQALENANSGKPYLGDKETVNSLLRMFLQRIMTQEHDHPNAFAQTVDHAARELAKTFLGRDKQYSAPKWNSPGNIDVYLGHWYGTDSADPEERVAGALVQLVLDYYRLANTIQDDQLIEEQWTDEANDMMTRYVCRFLGVKESGQRADPVHTLPPSALRKRS